MFALVALVISTPSFGDTEEGEVVMSNQTVNTFHGLPVQRMLCGGTKIIPEFIGNWDNDMIGAFNYACRIWEEAIPTTYPVRIRAVLRDYSTNATTNSVLSKVSFTTYTGVEHYSTNCATISQIKGTMFDDVMTARSDHAYDTIASLPMFLEPQMTITINNYKNLRDYMSFSLDESCDDDHFDFVTLVMREIGRGFGILWNSHEHVDPVAQTISCDPTHIPPYEHSVYSSLVNSTLPTLFESATQGELTVSTGAGNVKLYAPSNWDQHKSLNYFIPDSTKKLTQLLDWNYGKGMVVRDIADSFTYNFFRNALQWRCDVAVGMGGVSGSSSGTYTTDHVDYHGDIDFGSTTGVSSCEEVYKPLAGTKVEAMQTREETDTLWQHLDRFHPNYDEYLGNSTSHGMKVGVQKKDGTWDVVCDEPSIPVNVNVPYEDLYFHYGMNAYARSCDGYLKCRVVKYSADPRNSWMSAQYFLMDELPQKAPLAQRHDMIGIDDNPNSYVRQLDLTFCNMEGATQVYVNQLEEGDYYPMVYQTTNFKDGKVTVMVDDELETTIWLTVINANGTVQSDTCVVEPLYSDAMSFTPNVSSSTISLLPTSQRFNGKQLLKDFEIAALDLKPTAAAVAPQRQSWPASNAIDISSLKKGLYVLTATDIRGGRHSFKFQK